MREASGGELDHGKRARRDLNAPRLHRRSLTDDRAASIDKGDVDRELHEKSMNAVAGCEDECRIAGELRSTEKPLVTRRGIEGSFDDGRNDAVVTDVAQDPGRFGVGQEVVEK